MKVELSRREVNVIRSWSDLNIHGGHWGNGDVVLPEEGIILQKLSGGGPAYEFTMSEIRIILIWAEKTLLDNQPGWVPDNWKA